MQAEQEAAERGVQAIERLEPELAVEIPRDPVEELEAVTARLRESLGAEDSP